MMVCSMRDAFVDLFCLFCSTVLQCGIRMPIHTQNNCHVVSGAIFITGVVLECNIAHRRSVAVLYVYTVYNTKYNPMGPLYGALYVPYLLVRVTHTALFAYRHSDALLAAGPHSTTGLLFPYQYIDNMCVCYLT